MSTDYLQASAQYNDWKGSVGADDADQRAVHNLLVERDLLDPDTEMIVAVDIYIGENHNGEVKPPYVHAVIVDGQRLDEIRDRIAGVNGPFQARRVDVELSLEELLGLFKRFSIVLTRRDMGLDGREYQYED